MSCPNCVTSLDISTRKRRLAKTAKALSEKFETSETFTLKTPQGLSDMGLA